MIMVKKNSEQGFETSFLHLQVSCSFLNGTFPEFVKEEFYFYIAVPLECAFILQNCIYNYCVAHFSSVWFKEKREEKLSHTFLSPYFEVIWAMAGEVLK